MDSKDISKDITNFNKREWSKAEEELCLPGIRAKFFQNPGLMAALLNTGNKNLVESSYDDLWGTGLPLSDPAALDESWWKTIGLLGKMLMKVRAEKVAIISGNEEMPCMAGCICGRVECMTEGACMVGETATAADGMHPTGMHSWFYIFLTKLEIT